MKWLLAVITGICFFAGVLIGICLFASMASAQTVGCGSQKKWNYDAVEMFWEWILVVDPPPSLWRVRAGTQLGVYTIIKFLPATQYAIALTDLVPGPGAYFADVTPMYSQTVAAGKPSVACPFDSAQGQATVGIRQKP